MKLTYTGHSGVVLSFEECNWVIDYFRGEMPALDRTKPLFVFSSHTHGDHFNPEVFKLFADFEKVTYVLAFDIEKKIKENKQELGITDKQLESIVYVNASEKYEFSVCGDFIGLETFVSTDAGVAFLMTYKGKKIYHAGDLNWWAWYDNDEKYAKWMEDTYLGEVKKLSKYTVDLAFLPVDSRLEKNAFMGPDAFLRAVKVKSVYPIHMSGDYELTKKLRADSISEPYREVIHDFDFDGQEFDIDL